MSAHAYGAWFEQQAEAAQQEKIRREIAEEVARIKAETRLAAEAIQQITMTLHIIEVADMYLRRRS